MNLSESITQIKFISSKYELSLNKLGIFSIKDLLTHFPRSYLDASKALTIKDIVLDPDFTKEYLIEVDIKAFKNKYIRRNLSIQEAEAADGTGEIKCKFFNQVYLKSVLIPGSKFLMLGKIKKVATRLEFYPKIYDRMDSEKDSVHLGRIVPEYKLTSGITKKWFRNRIYSLIEEINNKGDLIPNELEKVGIKSENLNKDIAEVHFPSDLGLLEQAIDRLSFLEIVNLHLKMIEKNKDKDYSSRIQIDKAKSLKLFDEFQKNLAFELTLDQRETIEGHIISAINGRLINSLVQGDVGSGKTMVALVLSLLLAKHGYQTAILCPTTILAKQHFESFTKLLGRFGVKIDLVSSENKNNILDADILIGTSAILARKHKLIENLGLIIVDEQHRFGVAQREELLSPFTKYLKDIPHFVNMTATPIPRTIAETFFGDLEVYTINEKPKGRIPIKTFVVPEAKRTDSYKWIEDKIKKENEQVYWVCPFIEQNDDKSGIKSVNEVYKEISTKIKARIEILHGKLKSAEKVDIMNRFKDGQIDILVATSVIEVGIDVPNANVMVIENSDRFGLAQLHQIRGRVGRSLKESFCFLFESETLSEQGIERLDMMVKSDNGLELAEFDLKLRGPGEVYGERQSGLPSLKIAKLNDIERIRKAKDYALRLYENNIKKIEIFS